MSPVPRAVRHELEALQHEVVRDREVLLEANVEPADRLQRDVPRPVARCGASAALQQSEQLRNGAAAEFVRCCLPPFRPLFEIQCKTKPQRGHALRDCVDLDGIPVRTTTKTKAHTTATTSHRTTGGDDG